MGGYFILRDNLIDSFSLSIQKQSLVFFTKYRKAQASLFLCFTYPSCLLDGGACVMTEVGEGRVG